MTETEPEELLAEMVQCPKCEWWTNAPKFHAATCPADRPYPIPDLKDIEIARLRAALSHADSHGIEKTEGGA